MKRRKGDDNGFEAWGGYMEAKISKLEGQFSADAAKCITNENDAIFKGISIFVNGYTIPPADELKQLMIKYGGIYHHYHISSRTTYIIASNLPNTKIKQLKGMKVVKPEWIVDCIAQKKLLDYRGYLLYTNQSRTQPKLDLITTIPSSNTNMDNIEKFQKESTNKMSTDIQFSNCFSNYENNSTNKSDITLIKGDNPTRQKMAKNACEASFLSEFYTNSRLHHISTMGATLKQHVSNLRINNTCELGVQEFKEWLLTQPNNNNLDNGDDYISFDEKQFNNLIMHIDMDCFFVSVGLRSMPDLIGFPVAVTHAKSNSQGVKREGVNRAAEFNLYKNRAEEKMNQNKSKKEEETIREGTKPRSDWVESIDETNSMSEIASCNYEARKAGLKNGMFLGQALKLCPNLKTIPYDFDAYKEVSYTLYNTVASYTLNIEAVSCDEMFADCSELINQTSTDPMQFATFLRKKIKEKTGCACTTGFGSNRLQARLATKKAKPDGQLYLSPNNVIEFMQGINVNDIPGVGRATSYKLSKLGINTCQDLQKMSLSKLQAEFGKKSGESLYKNCRGQDEKILNFGQERKSVSAEVNYGIRFNNEIDAETFLKQLTMEVHSRLLEIKRSTKCITLKLMVRAKDAPEETAKFLGHGVCDNFTKSSTLASPTIESSIILREILALNKQLNISPKDMRGIGIQLSRLEDDNLSKTRNSSINKFLVPKNKENNNTVKNQRHEKCKNELNKNTEDKTVKGIGNFFKPKKLPINLKKSDVKINKKEDVSLDKEVLAALPEDLRKEIFAEYGLSESYLLKKENCDKERLMDCNQRNKNIIDSQFIDIRSPISEQSSKPSSSTDFTLSTHSDDTNETNSDGLDIDLSLSEIRTLIYEWVSSGQTAQECDVVIFKDFLERLVLARRLEKLDIVLRALHRHIANKRSETWQQTYFKIVDQIQDVMKTVYGAKLFVEDRF
uniref:DNA repair protein REV1 n=1 Tax=Clastoptera arizonana TaxID=38151 RepID=A0A1B6D5V3_9HEMI